MLRTPPRLTFRDRLGNHEAFRADVGDFFRERGCLVQPYGVESMPADFHKALVGCGNDSTAQFLRFQPDQALIVVTTKAAHLCEIKSTLPHSTYGNIAYELASLETAMRLDSIGVSVFVVFGAT